MWSGLVSVAFMRFCYGCPSKGQLCGQPTACKLTPVSFCVWGGVLIRGANRAHEGCTMLRTPGCYVGSHCALGWLGGLPPSHDSGHGDRTNVFEVDLEINNFLCWGVLLSHCMNLEQESRHTHWDSVSVDVRRKVIGMRSARELGAIPSSIICPTAGFWTVLSLSKPSPQLLLGSNKRSQAIAACMQWLRVGTDVGKLDFILMSWFISFLVFFEKKVCNIDHKNLLITITGNQVWN